MKKILIIIGIVILFFGVSVIPSISAVNKQKTLDVSTMRKIWYVDDDGNDYPNPDFYKIQDAIDNASGGDEIRVYAGYYPENVVVNKNLDLI